MEPIKVQSEGGLNVTLTIRLLMHGKVPTLVSETNRDAAFLSPYLPKTNTYLISRAPGTEHT